MAEEGNALREYLVSLRYKTDEESERKFDQGIAASASRVTALGAAVAGTVTAVAVGTAKIADNLEDLYYSAQRTGSGAEELESFGYAAQQLGSDAAEARGAAESLAQQIRQTPGTEDMLRGLGINTRDANGELRGTVDLLRQFTEVTSGMEMHQAQAYARAINIPERLFLAMRNGDFDRLFKQYREMATASDLGDAAEQSKDFMQSIRQLQGEFYLLSVRASAALNEAIGPELEDFADWMRVNGPAMAESMADWTSGVIDNVQDVSDWFKDADEATNGWSTAVAKLTAALWLLSKTPFGKIAGGLALMALGRKGGIGMGAATRLLGGLGIAGAGGYAAGTQIEEYIKDDAKDPIGRLTNDFLANMGLEGVEESDGADPDDAPDDYRPDYWRSGIDEALTKVMSGLGLDFAQDRVAEIEGGIPYHEYKSASEGYVERDSSETSRERTERTSSERTRERTDTSRDRDTTRERTERTSSVHERTDRWGSADLARSLERMALGLQNQTAAAFNVDASDVRSLADDGNVSRDRQGPLNRAQQGAREKLASIFFRSQGWTREQTAGLVANIRHESNFDENARGDGGQAHGLAQWHQARRDNYEDEYGESFGQADFFEQLKFIQHELTSGTYARAGDALRAADNARQAGSVVSRMYEIPANGDREARERGQTATEISMRSEIYVNGTDSPKDVAEEVNRTQDDHAQKVVRNMRGVAY